MEPQDHQLADGLLVVAAEKVQMVALAQVLWVVAVMVAARMVSRIPEVVVVVTPQMAVKVWMVLLLSNIHLSN